MAIKRTVMLAGVSSAVLIVGSSGFAFANGILGGHRADPVGSYVPVAARVVDDSQPASPAPSHAKEVPPTVGQSTTSVAQAEQGESDVDQEQPPVSPIPVAAPVPPINVVTQPTVYAAEPADDEPGAEYTKDDSEHEREHEDEAEIDDDHHGRDDDD